MYKCHDGFSGKLELFKYCIQAVYFLVGLYFHVKIYLSLYRRWTNYSKYPFYKLYLVDSILSLLIILIDLGIIRINAFIVAICPWAVHTFPESSQLISLLFIENYLKFAKCLNFCFMMINRASCVLCPASSGTIQKCITIHIILFSLLCPLLGVWPAFLSDSQFVPFQGGFIHESMMTFRWVSLAQFSVIIGTIAITTILICSLICIICISRTRSENRHTEQGMTASAMCMGTFYVLVLSLEIFVQQYHPTPWDVLEFWKAIVMFSFDMLVICPPIIMLCLNVRLRTDVYHSHILPTTTTPPSVK